MKKKEEEMTASFECLKKKLKQFATHTHTRMNEWNFTFFC